MQLLLHPQRRIERALRMILVRDRRAEQREDAVAGRLHDVTVVAMHGVDHQLERRIDDRARLFRVEVLLSSVEPLMSANSAVTVLRSPSVARLSGCSDATQYQEVSIQSETNGSRRVRH